MTYGVRLMHELLADSSDIQALVSTAVSSLPHFSSLCNNFFNPLCMPLPLLVAIVDHKPRGCIINSKLPSWGT